MSLWKNRSFWIGISGNILEHYDAALFSLLAPFLAPLFFPSENPALSLIMTYSLLPIGFLSKPMGAFFFGWLGDRFGRKKSLSLSLLGMASATAAMGFLPTYEQIGSWAPLLLTASRAIQSFFAAGETTGGAIFILERVPEEERCLASSLFDASGILGILLGSALVTVYSENWRWMFWAGALTGLIGVWLRWDRSVERTSQIHQSPLKILWKERSSVFAIACVAGFSYINYSLITTFMNGFLPLVSTLSKKQAMELNTLLLGFDFALLPLFGWLAKNRSKDRLMLVAIALIILLSIPLFQLLEGATVSTATFVRLTLTLLGVALAAPFHAWAYDRAPAEHRFLICAVGTAIGSRMIGSTTPALSLWLYQSTNWAPAAVLPLWIFGLFALYSMIKKLEPTRQLQNSLPQKNQ